MPVSVNKPDNQQQRYRDPYFDELIAWSHAVGKPWVELPPFIEKAKAGDKQAREIVIASTTRLIVKYALYYASKGDRGKHKGNGRLAPQDFVAASLGGIDRAIVGFDPAKSLWSSYATWWIRQAAQRQLDNHGWIGRIPASCSQSETMKRAAEEFKARKTLWIDRTIPNVTNGGGSERPLYEIVTNDCPPDAIAASNEERIYAHAAMSAMHQPKGRAILEARYGLGAKHAGKPMTLEALSKKTGKSRLELRKAESEALRRLTLATAGLMAAKSSPSPSSEDSSPLF